ncbi:Mth938-like domain-containing protein [Nitrosococcus oceani]|uniref:Xcc1710-like domain-containing protein n=2 Tax=Nitrosococcus oceani TaxID=1229 RepID=Q3JEN1_NITOC|nr:Mth938-like domain-containing protein [Nitrosococcus oceani]KFI20850.1 hypothetical protein IB75_00905 [Nitrosococcus oceani C-27]ABA56715.1 Protein of unknown function DUF598 [Nitrosococcus oceani ATCC 19707]EDZ65603.1 conserved hypothetical protein [Nitrosococcus oceani AFC27]KFI23963.1 hypothetical protein HW44_00935 [Nitrosococcus oceani]GEM21623.1 hypothetical protein NONS58_30720 [Nitrosococcus oceani]
MKFSLDERTDVYTVSAYGSGYVEFRIPVSSEKEPERLQGEGLKENRGRQKICRNVVVSPGRLQEWSPASFSELEKAHFQAFLEMEPEVVVVGTGEQSHFLSPRLIEPLLRHQIGVEFMDTAAACRTYNILVGEGRRVVAALFIIRQP